MQTDPRIPSREALGELSSELDAQPALLRALADRWATPQPTLEALVHRRGGRVAFVGLGSSRDAALAGQWLLRSAGIDATVHMPSELLGALPDGALVVPISASGTTSTVVEALGRLDPSIPTLALTRTVDAPIGASADVVATLGCEQEPSGIATWSFLSTLAALAAIAELATDGATVAAVDAMRRAADVLERLRSDARASIDGAAAVVGSASVVHLVAPMSRLGPALQATQVLREVPRIPAVALAAEDWDHAHAYLTVDPGYVALVSGPTDADDELRTWVIGRRRVMVCLGEPLEPGLLGVAFDEDPLVRLLIECPIVESIALEAWAAAGREAGISTA